MKRTAIIFIFLFFYFLTKSQVAFKTIVPQQPVISGESFQVQYIIEDGEKVSNLKPPVFNNFRFVAGPNIYIGSVSTSKGVKPLKNAVYTLEAGRPGKFIIPGASASFNGKIIRSNDVIIQVISKQAAAKFFDKEINGNSDYFLKPGEDVYEKIKHNLFVKLMVDKKNCYVGEAVLATFKLYSRLESKSDIVKNPGFYGFTVYDMVNLGDKQVTTENINGKIFDVHTIRKVQLYPLQAGVFTIDAMQVKNRVEFSRSAVNKKTEQEITEGILGNIDSEVAEEGKKIVETEIHTEPVLINIKSLPEKNKPETFSGATGHFTISAALLRNVLQRNEEGFLEVTIRGKGNFIQISAPSINWPAGIEAFEPVVQDNLNKTMVPLTGSRIFRYPFVCSSPGSWQLSPVSFSFFDTDSNSYKTVTSNEIRFVVSREEKKNIVVLENKSSIADKNARASRIAAGIVLLFVLTALLYWLKNKKDPPPAIVEETVPARFEELLQPATQLLEETDKEFYTELHHLLWQYLCNRFGLQGSGVNKETLITKLHGDNIDEQWIRRLQHILIICEAGMFTNASLGNDKSKLVNDTKELLDEMNSA